MKLKVYSFIKPEERTDYKQDDFIEKASSSESDSLWKSIKTYVFKLAEENNLFFSNNIKDLLPMAADGYRQGKLGPGALLTPTVKGCPAITDFLRQSYVIKLPIDLYINVDENGHYYVHRVDYKDVIEVTSHPVPQRVTEDCKNQLYPNKLSIKFSLPIRLKSNKRCKWMFSPPVYHINVQDGYHVVPGLYFTSEKHFFWLNINTMLDYGKEYYFKAGTPLCYLTNTDIAAAPRIIPNNDMYVDNVPDRKTVSQHYKKEVL